MKTIPDLWNGCYDGEHRRLSPEAFKKQFCNNCMNAGCRNSKGADTAWTKRILVQEDVLLNNPKFAEVGDPRFLEYAQMDFQSRIQEALAIEVASRKGDWSVPTEKEIGQAAAEMLGIVQPTNFQKTPLPSEIDWKIADEIKHSPLEKQPPKKEAPQEIREEEKWRIRGDSGTIYEVKLSPEGVWSCSCPSRENPCKHARDIELKLSRAPRNEPPRDNGPTKPPADAPATPQGKTLNTSVPSQGIFIGGAPPKEKVPDDPWAPPKTPKERVIPVGGRVSFSRK